MPTATPDSLPEEAPLPQGASRGQVSSQPLGRKPLCEMLDSSEHLFHPLEEALMSLGACVEF